MAQTTKSTATLHGSHEPSVPQAAIAATIKIHISSSLYLARTFCALTLRDGGVTCHLAGEYAGNIHTLHAIAQALLWNSETLPDIELCATAALNEIRYLSGSHLRQAAFRRIGIPEFA
ncbi:MAG: hypothetical protein E2576_11110 [Alcaligenaceae bacterium]|nr:hypothetical protein [Alcaligenaceae bacterium SAGV5]MPS51243.1 hypothetical protein [Alcaligenaceae bacterium SAGV3]MPT57260.1 hypothetical protein [Alcaligenaceae bacterium]